MNSIAKRVAIVVPSCDKYSDLWDALFATIRLKWTECPFTFYLVSNFIESPTLGVTTIKVGEDKTWSANLIFALEQVPHEYVLLFIDDLFLSQCVDHDRVVGLIQRSVNNSWDYLRFNPIPGPEAVNMIDGGVGKILPGDWYRSSTVLSLWKKSVLMDVLRPNENAWEFEVFGSQRTDKYFNWFASSNWLMPYENLVIKGKIDPSAFRLIVKAGTKLETARPVMSSLELSRFKIKKFRTTMMRFVPREYRRAVRGFFSAT